MMRAAGCTSAIAARGGTAPQILRRRLAHALVGAGGGEQRQVLLERPWCPFGPRWSANVQLGREEPWLLAVGHEDLRMALEHLIQRRRAALGVADDEEVGDPLGAAHRISLVLGAAPIVAPAVAGGIGSARRSRPRSRRRSPRRSDSRSCAAADTSIVSNATSLPSMITITRSQMSSVDIR